MHERGGRSASEQQQFDVKEEPIRCALRIQGRREKSEPTRRWMLQFGERPCAREEQMKPYRDEEICKENYPTRRTARMQDKEWKESAADTSRPLGGSSRSRK
jgi:hypothetical protein